MYVNSLWDFVKLVMGHATVIRHTMGVIQLMLRPLSQDRGKHEDRRQLTDLIQTLRLEIPEESPYHEGAGEAEANHACFVDEETQESVGVYGVQPEDWKRVLGNGWTEVTALVDSGCGKHVSPKVIAPHIPITPTRASVAGLGFSVANGDTVANEGQKEIPILTEPGDKSSIVYNIAEVTRPLNSVGQHCDAGNLVLFGASGGVIYHLDTGKMTPFRRRNKGQYEMKFGVPPTDQKTCQVDTSGFARQGS